MSCSVKLYQNKSNTTSAAATTKIIRVTKPRVPSCQGITTKLLAVFLSYLVLGKRYYLPTTVHVPRP